MIRPCGRLRQEWQIGAQQVSNLVRPYLQLLKGKEVPGNTVQRESLPESLQCLPGLQKILRDPCNLLSLSCLPVPSQGSPLAALWSRCPPEQIPCSVSATFSARPRGGGGTFQTCAGICPVCSVLLHFLTPFQPTTSALFSCDFPQ